MASSLVTDQQLQALIAAGVQAPSADNHHAVRFVAHGECVAMLAAPEALVPIPIHRRAFLEFSFGAVLENITLAAAREGFSCEVETHQHWRRDDARVATLWFRRAGTECESDSLAEQIFARHTNRRLYARRPVPRSALDRLAAEAAYPNIHVQWLDTPETRREALRMIRRAEAERFRRAKLHDELFDSIRFAAGWRETCEEGLPPGALEIEPPLRAPFRALRHWPLQRTLNWFGAAVVLGWRAGWLPAWNAPHLGLVCCSGQDSDRWMPAGRAFQRLWLAATQAGLALQPMAASIALAAQDAGDGWVDAGLHARLRETLLELAGGAQACMVFRLGYAPPPRVIAGRRPVAAYLQHAA